MKSPDGRGRSACRRWFVWAAIVALFLDQASKVAVYGMLKPGESARVIDNVLRFIHADNPQGVFGLSFGPQWVYFVMPVVGIVLVLWYGLRCDGTWMAAAFGMILGGAVGNLADRIRFGGRVIDFIDVSVRGWHWFTFNLSDAFIVTGIIMVLAREFLWRKRPAPAADPAAPTANADDQSLPR